MTSVLRCGDDGCLCRNLPNRTDQGDTERLRAELRYVRGELRIEESNAEQAEAKAARLEARIMAAITLHPTYQVGDNAYCDQCTDVDNAVRWPCPTVAALAGEADQ